MFPFGDDEPEDFAAARQDLVERLDRRESLSTAVRDAMLAVPRHAFVPEDRRDSAYADRPLPIGQGQTISAPHMVAIMAEVLSLEAGERVLEIGTGCGYHAAVTAELVGPGNVFSVELEPELAKRARSVLEATGYGAVSVRVGDGREGWPEHAPYDAAYVTCATSTFPDPVVEQVRVGGRLLAPIGDAHQELVLADRTGEGLARERHGAVRFVPMRGSHNS